MKPRKLTRFAGSRGPAPERTVARRALRWRPWFTAGRLAGGGSRSPQAGLRRFGLAGDRAVPLESTCLPAAGSGRGHGHPGARGPARAPPRRNRLGAGRGQGSRPLPRASAAPSSTAGPELANVRWRADGRPEPWTLIKRDQCRHLAAYACSTSVEPGRDQVVAVRHPRGDKTCRWLSPGGRRVRRHPAARPPARLLGAGHRRRRPPGATSAR